MADLNRIRLARLGVTAADRPRIRIGRVASITVATPAGAGNRARVSRVRATTVTPPSAVSRLRLSRVRVATAAAGPPALFWIDGQLIKPRLAFWIDGQLIPITDTSTVVLPPPPTPTDLETDTETDTE